MDVRERSAIFLDRDGVICVEKDLMCKKEDMELIKKSSLAIKNLNDQGYLVVIVSNQSVVARGLCDFKNVEEMNRHLERIIFEESSGVIDKMYICPHHPNPKVKIGNKGLNLYYVKDCDCRKPKIGMIIRAKKDLDIDLTNSYVVGDKTSDIKMGNDAGCKTILVKTGYGGRDSLYDVQADFIFKNLYEFSKYIITKK